MPSELLHIGFGNVLAINRVLAIVSPQLGADEAHGSGEQERWPNHRYDERSAHEGCFGVGHRPRRARGDRAGHHRATKCGEPPR